MGECGRGAHPSSMQTSQAPWHESHHWASGGGSLGPRPPTAADKPLPDASIQTSVAVTRAPDQSPSCSSKEQLEPEPLGVGAAGREGSGISQSYWTPRLTSSAHGILFSRGRECAGCMWGWVWVDEAISEYTGGMLCPCTFLCRRVHLFDVMMTTVRC